MIQKENYKLSLDYIERFWTKITYSHTSDRQIHLGLPHKYVSPNDDIFKKDQFYWDSYFTILGLVKSNKVSLAQGMVDNFIYLFKRFGIMPMRNRYYNLGTSQIPFLTSMALEIYEHTKDLLWLKKAVNIAEMELKNYWMSEGLTEKHIVYKGLSRYCDHFITHLGAEHESGWDMTSRFNDRCLDYLPIDLNTCLYKYETDLSEVFRLLKNYDKHKYYKEQALKRKNMIMELMWNEEKNFFFDYNKFLGEQSSFISVAGFYPLWAKMASEKQAERIVKYILPLLESKGGVLNTQAYNLSEYTKQHDCPNGWPHQQWIVVKGLLNYGYKNDAERIAKKWLDMNHELFIETGKFWEKHNVVKRGVGEFNPDRYPTQSGFAWTNAVFVRLINEFENV
ncbi:MAG: trehalase family glycosidase [Flavobacteriales bacterium]